MEKGQFEKQLEMHRKAFATAIAEKKMLYTQLEALGGALDYVMINEEDTSEKDSEQYEKALNLITDFVKLHRMNKEQKGAANA